MNARSAWRLPHSCGYLWAARAAAVLLLGLWLLFVAAHGGLPPLGKQPWSVRLIFAGWLAVFISYAAGWRHPLLGGALGVAGLAFMNAVELWVNGTLLGPWFFLWGVPSVLYLVAAWTARSRPTCAP